MRGCDPALITRWKKRGWLVMRDGLVDVAASEAIIDANRDPRRVGEVRSKAHRGARGQVVAMDEIRAARLRAELANAERLERENRQARGELVERSGVEQAAEAIAKVLADRLATLPARIATRIAALAGREVREVHVEVEQAIEDLQQVVADELCRMKETEPATT